MKSKVKYVLALDQGTTSSRALLFDRRGRVCAMAQEEFRQFYPQPGWVEHDPEEIWSSQRRTARLALRRAGAVPADIAAIGIANQRETTLLWNRRTGRAVAPAIVWQDRRTAAFCDGLKAAGHEPAVRRKTGLVLDAYFSGTKLRWLLDHVRGARRQAEAGDLAFGTVDTWLLWRLTGGAVHATDISNASRTLLMDLRRGRWDDSLLDLLGVPASVLPEIRASSGEFGMTREFGGEIPVCGVAGDQQAALFGQACHSPGMVKNTYGTGCFMLMHTGTTARVSRSNLLTTAAWTLDGRTEYALEGSVFVAGAAVQWLRDALGLIRKSADVERLAAGVPDTAGVYFVPAFAGLGAPHWDMYARGLIAGLTRGVTSAHIARAALEGIAYQVFDVLKAMEADSGIRLRELRADGGACANNLLMQFQADILGVPVVRPRVAETTALGAAYLAGLAVGFWRDRAELTELWQRDRRFEPALGARERRVLCHGWTRALERARGWVEPRERA